jgi:hypothetical protein
MLESQNNLDVIAQTKSWIETVIIAHGFCPFAKAVFDNGGIHYQVTSANSIEDCLKLVIDECLLLDSQQQFETSFIIFAQAFADFEQYLEAIALAESLVEKQGYAGIYQIASFHPDYCFANQAQQDPANYTNRSPFPMMHIIRESSLDKALQSFSQAEEIPNRNIRVARELGLEKMHRLLDDCYNNSEK